MPAKVVPIRPPVTIGGSQVANAIGLGWSSPIRLFGELTGKPGFEPTEDTPALRLGRALEPVIFEELRELGYPARALPDVELRDPDRPYLIGHPDGLVDYHVVEAKAQAWKHDDPSADVQTLTYMHLGGFHGGLIATLTGLHLEVRELERNNHYIATILALLERFWAYVEADEWPPPTGHPDDRPAILDANPEAQPAKVARETKEIREARLELARMNAADGKHGARARRKAYLGALITDHMGDAETLVDVQDEAVAHWRNVTARRFDRKAFERDHPKYHAHYTYETTTRRLTL